MTAEIKLIRTMKKRDNYDKYHRFVKDYTLLSEAATIVDDIGEYFKYHPECTEIDWSDFQVWFRINKHPAWKPEQHEVYKRILDNVALEDTASDEIVARFIELDYASQIHEETQKVFAESNTGGLTKVESLIHDYLHSSRELSGTGALVEVNAIKFAEAITAEPGLNWRLEDLNKSVGPVRQGDLIFVGKRPEVGGTTFLTSEFSHMITQLPEGKHAIIFNNEETGWKIGMRLIQSTLGCTVPDIMANPALAQADYTMALDGHRIDVYHDTSTSVSDIERILRSGDYGLIGINILDKLQGFYKDEGVARLRLLAIWARGIADKYGAVFAVAQADASAEGVRYLDQSQLYGSKTGFQGEADIQIMIGKDNGPGLDGTRYFNIVKNKNIGLHTDPTLRHGKFEVAFDGERARFHSSIWS